MFLILIIWLKIFLTFLYCSLLYSIVFCSLFLYFVSLLLAESFKLFQGLSSLLSSKLLSLSFLLLNPVQWLKLFLFLLSFLLLTPAQGLSLFLLLLLLPLLLLLLSLQFQKLLLLPLSFLFIQRANLSNKSNKVPRTTWTSLGLIWTSSL